MIKLKNLNKLVFYLLIIILSFSCNKQITFKELDNGNIISSNNIEYDFFSNEGFIVTFGKSKFLGKMEFENSKLYHSGRSRNIGMYLCNKQNDDILYRVKPNSEWITYYQKTSLPKIDLVPENCIKFEMPYFNNKKYKHNISIDDIYICHIIKV